MRPRDDILDELLVLRCQAGDASALELLVRRFDRRFVARACRLTGDVGVAPEVVQEAWLAIVRGLGRLQDPARFRAWAYRIVANKARDWIRRTSRRRSLADRLMRENGAEAAVVAPASEDPSAEKERDLRRLREGLATLPAEQRSILELFYLDALPVRDVAEILGIPEGTVKSRLFHARKQLRTLLED